MKEVSHMSPLMQKEVRTVSSVCPDCGHEKMKELGRTKERGKTYIWFECSARGCRGRLLETKTL